LCEYNKKNWFFFYVGHCITNALNLVPHLIHCYYLMCAHSTILVCNCRKPLVRLANQPIGNVIVVNFYHQGSCIGNEMGCLLLTNYYQVFEILEYLLCRHQDRGVALKIKLFVFTSLKLLALDLISLNLFSNSLLFTKVLLHDWALCFVVPVLVLLDNELMKNLLCIWG
jgi:hypothetical protein